MEGERGKEGALFPFGKRTQTNPSGEQNLRYGRTDARTRTSGPTQLLKLAAVLDGVGAGGARFAHVPLHRHALITALY